MKKKLIYSLFIILIIQNFLFCPLFPFLVGKENRITKIYPLQAEIVENVPVFQKGLSYSAWSIDAFNTPESDQSLTLLKETHTEWIALCFSWFQSNTTSYDIHIDSINSPSTESIQHTITAAHSLGIKVMLKPMVEPIERQNIISYPIWRGEIQPSDEWFENYSNFINFFAEFAEQNNVEMFCIGCEYKETTKETEHWEEIIEGIKKRFSGPITYAADWTNYENIDWWNLVDYVGIDAYFPLSLFNNDPTIEELKTVWRNHVNNIEEWLTKINKPVIFTEIGYRSGDGTSTAPSNYWTEMTVDLEEQKNCYEAAFQELWNKNWFFGFYWWTWIFDPQKGGFDDSSHTPQNKPAQDVLTNWYSLERKLAVIDQSFTTAENCKINEVQSIGFHVRWDKDGSDFVYGKVYVNETEYVTNETGWITFSTSYDTIGKRSWFVTSVQHPETSGYMVLIENPHIIWDKLEINIEVYSNQFGMSGIRGRINYAYARDPITGATLFINNKQCKETKPGVYETQIYSWNPYLELNIQTDVADFATENFSITAINPMNVLIYIAIFVSVIVIVALILKLRKGKKFGQFEDVN